MNNKLFCTEQCDDNCIPITIWQISNNKKAGKLDEKVKQTREKSQEKHWTEENSDYSERQQLQQDIYNALMHQPFCTSMAHFLMIRINKLMVWRIPKNIPDEDCQHTIFVKFSQLPLYLLATFYLQKIGWRMDGIWKEILGVSSIRSNTHQVNGSNY